MSLTVPSRWAKKRHLDFPEKKVNIVKIKQRKVLSSELFARFSPKHYPCIFLDQRLKTRFFR